MRRINKLNNSKKFSVVMSVVLSLSFSLNSMIITAESATSYKFNLEKRLAAELVSQSNPSLFDNVESEYKNNSDKKYIKQQGDKKIYISWEPNIVNEVLSIFDSSDSDNESEYTEDEKAVYVNRVNDESYLSIDPYYSRDNKDSSWDMLYNLLSTDEHSEIITQREPQRDFSRYDRYYGKHLCDNGEFSCLKLKQGDTWKTLFPDPYTREVMQRINRTNRGLWNRKWILVPNNTDLHYMEYSPMAYYRDTGGKKLIVINQEKLAFGAYNQDGYLAHWGPINPGKAGTSTPKGESFKVYRKGTKSCWSKKFDTGIPYCLFFHKGFAMHGYAMPGYPASHGCVRVFNSDAKWLNKEFADYNTRVIVE